MLADDVGCTNNEITEKNQNMVGKSAIEKL